MALLDFDWPNMRLKDKKNYHIIITYMVKDFSIQTAVGNDLSLCTMTAVSMNSVVRITKNAPVPSKNCYK